MLYKIIIAEGTAQLALEINAAIREGWVPTGGIAVRGRTLFQALIKKGVL